MKAKLLFLMFASGLFASCSSSDDGGDTNTSGAGNGKLEKYLANAPGTEVYVGVESLNNIDKVDNIEKVGASTRAENPLAPVVNVNYFNVKVDPRLGYNVSPSTYVGVVSKGMLYKDCPFVDIYDGNDNTYLFSTNGTGLRTLIAAGDTTTASVVRKVASLYKRNRPQSPTLVEENIHVIWYLSKHMNNGWHIDGLLTDKADIKDACDACRDEGFQKITFGKDGRQITYEELVEYMPMIHNLKPIDKTLNVDIAQQNHSDWGEIKTTIHVKEAKDVTVYLPVSKAYTLENADTNEVVKYFQKTYEVQDYNGAIGSDVNVTVKRIDTGVTITITGITDELLKALERRYNDGLTVEVHTFYKLTDENGVGDYKQAVWQSLKESTVSYDGAKSGQITSAFYETEKVEIK